MNAARLEALKAARKAAKAKTQGKTWKQLSGADKDEILKATAKMLGLWDGE